MKFHSYTGKAYRFVHTKTHRKVMQSYIDENRVEGITPDELLRKGSGTLCENLLMADAF